MEDMFDFAKIGCMVIGMLVGALSVLFAFLGLVSMPFEQKQCEMLGAEIEHRWEFFGGCYVKDQKTGAYMTYEKWESINGTIDAE